MILFIFKKKTKTNNKCLVSTLYGTFGSGRFEFLSLHMWLSSKTFKI